jgi:AraC family transcriptional regulator
MDRIIWMQGRTSPESFGDYVHGTLLSHGSGKTWNSVLVRLLSHQPSESRLLVPAVAEPLLVWIVSGSARIEERDLGGSWQANDVAVGDFYLTNTSSPYEMRWTTLSPEPFLVMHLYLSLPIYEHAVKDVLGDAGSSFQLRDISGKRDAAVSKLLELIRLEMTESAEPSELYVHGMVQALAIHLVRTYGDNDTSFRRIRGSLPAFKLQRAARLMEAGLAGQFSLQALASEVGLSAFHFSRVFKQSTGYSPSAYFIQLKMTEARKLLMETEKSIVEIALDLGYSSPSHFSQVFKRAVGVRPSEYRG